MGIIKFLNSRKLNKIFNYEKMEKKEIFKLKKKIVKKRKFIKEEGLMDKDYNIHMTKKCIKIF